MLSQLKLSENPKCFDSEQILAGAGRMKPTKTGRNAQAVTFPVQSSALNLNLPTSFTRSRIQPGLSRFRFGSLPRPALITSSAKSYRWCSYEMVVLAEDNPQRTNQGGSDWRNKPGQGGTHRKWTIGICRPGCISMVSAFWTRSCNYGTPVGNARNDRGRFMIRFDLKWNKLQQASFEFNVKMYQLRMLKRAFPIDFNRDCHRWARGTAGREWPDNLDWSRIGSTVDQTQRARVNICHPVIGGVCRLEWIQRLTKAPVAKTSIPGASDRSNKIDFSGGSDFNKPTPNKLSNRRISQHLARVCFLVQISKHCQFWNSVSFRFIPSPAIDSQSCSIPCVRFGFATTSSVSCWAGR